MCDEQLCVKSLSKCESWLDKVIFFGYIVFKKKDFYGSKDIKVNVTWERLTNVIEVKKICLFHQVINDELWKDYLW